MCFAVLRIACFTSQRLSRANCKLQEASTATILERRDLALIPPFNGETVSATSLAEAELVHQGVVPRAIQAKVDVGRIVKCAMWMATVSQSASQIPCG
jgi:hypothetical protein